MKKRPLLIQLIAWGYFLSPISFIAQYFYFSGISAIDVTSWQQLATPYRMSFILVPPIIAIGIYKIHEWGWYLALSHILFLIGNNIAAFIIGSRTPSWAILFFSLATLTVLLLFVRKEIRAPYFNPRIRWWETKPRYAITLQIEISNEQKQFKGETYNISEGGLFMVSDADIDINEKFSLNMRRGDKNPVNCSGKIVWINPSGHELPKGFGIMFIKPDKKCVTEIQSYIKDQKNLLKKKSLYR